MEARRPPGAGGGPQGDCWLPLGDGRARDVSEGLLRARRRAQYRRERPLRGLQVLVRGERRTPRDTAPVRLSADRTRWLRALQRWRRWRPQVARCPSTDLLEIPHFQGF